MPKILVVDDNAKIVSVLAEYLKAEGFTPITAEDGTQAAMLATTQRPDLALVDIMMPGIDGFELTRMLQADGIPVIIVSARIEEADRIAGLRTGADDYVTKPFSPREVVERVRAVLRRTSHEPSAAPTVTVGGITIDPARREVVVDEGQVELTRTEFDILNALAQSHGRVLTRAELVEAGGIDHAEHAERTVDAHVKNIRRKLGDSNREHLRTVFGVGYKLEE